MADTSLVYNNQILNIDQFIDCILNNHFSAKQIPSCEIQENSQFYYIALNNYYKNNHTFQIYYKNNFLILQIRLRENNSKILSTRMFFLPIININKISHTYYSNSVTLKVPKIYYT